MQDAWRAYLELAFGLTEASKKKAKKTAKDLVGKGGATAAQLQSLTADLVSTSRSNREGLVRLVRYEVDRALGALGLATADEMAALTNRIHDLEQQVRASQPPPATATTTTTTATTPRKATAKKTVAKKAVAKKTVARKASTGAAATAPTTARKTTAKKTTG